MIKVIYEAIKRREDVLWVILLLLVAIVSHWEWFRFGNVLSFADTLFQNQETLREAFLTNTWIGNSGFGISNIQLYKLLFTSLQSFLAESYLQFTDIIRITHLIPIAILGFLSPYILIRHLTKEKLIAFVGAMFYGSTTPFIMRQYLGHSSVAFIIALAPLILYFFSLAIEKNTIRRWLIFILTYWIGACYEPRIMYIVTTVLVIYFLFFGASHIKICYRKIIMGIVLMLGLSTFWVLPIILGGFSEAIGNVAGRDLSGNAHYSITKSLALFHDNWTGDQPLVSSFQSIPWFFWIIPAITIIFFLFKPGKENKKIISFFGIVWLAGLFFTKQIGDPFPGAFQWLRENIPGFLVFRSGSKFWFVESLGYLGLLSFGLLWLKKKWPNRLGKLFFSSITIVVVTLSLWNLKPLILGKFGGMLAKREIPNDYFILKEYLTEQKNFFRAFWTPSIARWGFYSNRKPAISDVAVVDGEWKNLLKPYNDNEKLIQNRIMNAFKLSFADNLFDDSSIKYVIVPLQDKANDDDFFKDYGGNKDPNILQWYIDQIDKVSWLKKIDIGTNELVVYENENYKSPVSSFNNLYSIDSFANLDNKYDFINKNLGDEFYFAIPETKNDTKPTIDVFVPFENLGPENISTNSTIVATTSLDIQKKDILYNAGDINGKISINASPVAHSPKTLLSLATEEARIAYQNPAYSFSNIIINGSFESGEWQKKVGDCHNYDKNPIIAMSLNKEEKTDGEQSLQLEATRHMACSSIKASIRGGASYLLSFDYQSPNAKLASYYVGFNNKDKTTISANIEIKGTGWQTFYRTIIAPEDATTLSFYLYAKQTDQRENVINRYDNVKLIEIPKIDDKYYIVSEPKEKLVEPKSVDFELVNPTKKIVHIKGATTSFFLAMSESYHDQWQLQMNNQKIQGFFVGWWPFASPDKVGDEYHYKLNGFLNGWYVDTASLCQNNSACVKNGDGSYDIEMVIEFWPQRWFYLGLLISGTTLLGCLGYLGYDFYRRRKRALDSRLRGNDKEGNENNK